MGCDSHYCNKTVSFLTTQPCFRGLRAPLSCTRRTGEVEEKNSLQAGCTSNSNISASQAMG